MQNRQTIRYCANPECRKRLPEDKRPDADVCDGICGRRLRHLRESERRWNAFNAAITTRRRRPFHIRTKPGQKVRALPTVAYRGTFA